MLRCTCCGRWTVEQVTLDRMRGAGARTFIRVNYCGRLFDEYTTLAAAEAALIEAGVFEYLAEVEDELPRAA